MTNYSNRDASWKQEKQDETCTKFWEKDPPKYRWLRARWHCNLLTYFGLPNKSVRVGILQLLHDSLDSSSHLLRVWITAVHDLWHRNINLAFSEWKFPLSNAQGTSENWFKNISSKEQNVFRRQRPYNPRGAVHRKHYIHLKEHNSELLIELFYWNFKITVKENRFSWLL